MKNKRIDGKSPETAFIINDSKGEMNKSISDIVDYVFGANDGSYFIISESTMEPKDYPGRYKVLFIEDNDGNKHNVYFRIG